MGHWTISPFVLLFADAAVVTFETLDIVQQMRRGIPNSSSPETFGGLPRDNVVEFPKPSAGSRSALPSPARIPPETSCWLENVIVNQSQAFAQVIKGMS
jgi:hypothetical protein